jgi:hypothetical protein
MGETILDCPETDLGTVELEGVQSQSLRGSEAIRARWGARQTFFEEISDRLGPGCGVVTTRGSGNPQALFFSRAGEEVSSGECIETAAGDAKLFGGFGGGQDVLSDASKDMTDERRCVTMRELL